MPEHSSLRRDQASPWTRRHFLQAALAASAASPLISCSDLGLDSKEEKPLFDGPTIDEDGFIDFNARYYDAALDPDTKLPHNSIRDGVLSGETDPIAIAYRLQYLVTQAVHAATINTMLDHLLGAQINARPPRNYRNMLPRLAFKQDGTGIEPATQAYSFTENALLSSRVAMAAQAFKGTGIEDKALTFLDKQKAGYNRVFAQADSGFLPVFGHAGLFGVDPEGINLLFGGYYGAVAFVLSYFIGGTTSIADPAVGTNSWQAMIDAQNTYAGMHEASTKAAVTIRTPLARNGGGHQFFHALLAVAPDALTPSMSGALYNALFSYLDAAVYDRVPGIYSAAPNARGFLYDNGLNRLTARQRSHGSQERIVTADALAAAMRLFPESSDERLILRGWIGLFASVSGMAGTHGYYSGMTKQGEPILAMFARQNGAMILYKSDAWRFLDAFLQERGRPTMRELFGRIVLTYDGAPIQRVDSMLPLPPRQERLFTAR